MHAALSLRFPPVLGLAFAGLTLAGLTACGATGAPNNPYAYEHRDPPLVDAIEAVTRDEVVADFEGGGLTTWLPDGEGHFAADGAADALAVVGDGRDGDSSLRVSPAAIRVVANLSAEGAPLRRHDYSSCAGLTLVAKHDGDAGTRTAEVTVTSVGGVASFPLEITEDWAEIAVPFAALVAETAGPGGGEGGGAGAGAGGAGSGGAATATFDARSVLAFSLTALADADLLIDSIALTDCELLPLNPPLPEPPELGADAPAGSPVALHGQLRVQGVRLVDQSGEPFQLKGVSSMWLNMEADGYALKLGALRTLRDDWALTVFRAAMGVEEISGIGGYIDGTAGMMKAVETIIANALELGVYVIVDFHSHEAEQYPAEARGFFTEIAQKYGQYPNVIYEPFNEPTQQDWSAELKPYHETVIAAIRAVDPDNVIVLGNQRWSQLPNEAALDPVGATNLLYTAHFYACTHGPWLLENADAALAAGVGVFVTEWGATDADGGVDGVVCADEALPFLEWMAANGVGWAAWKLDDCSDSTCLVTEGAPTTGGWTDDQLHGHAPLVREWMRR